MVSSTFKYDEEIEEILRKGRYIYKLRTKEETFKKILKVWNKEHEVST